MGHPLKDLQYYRKECGMEIEKSTARRAAFGFIYRRSGLGKTYRRNDQTSYSGTAQGFINV